MFFGTNEDLKWLVEDLSFGSLDEVASSVAQEIKHSAQQGATDAEWNDSQAMCVVEEAGEFIAEYRRLRGFARRAGDREAMLSELADVVIAALVMFWNLDADPHYHVQEKLRKVVTRGFINKAVPESDGHMPNCSRSDRCAGDKCATDA
jgi:NTP pyrophosphatase (non-canonical NTP hydrolase)